MRLVIFIALAAGLLGASQSWAAAGDACTVSPPSTYTPKDEKPTCTLLCDLVEAGVSQTCGPIYVPRGGNGVKQAVIRAVSGTSAAGCGYDTFSIYEMSSGTAAAGTEMVLLGVLDDDGSDSGVKQIKSFGTIGPYIYADGGTATAGTCSASSRLQIQLLTWED